VLIAVHPLRGKQPFPGGWLFNCLHWVFHPLPWSWTISLLTGKKTPLGEDGQFDFEALEALDLELLGEDFVPPDQRGSRATAQI